MSEPQACDGCLRRAELLRMLAAYVTVALRAGRRVPALLALPDEQLIEALAGQDAADVRRRWRAIRPSSVREQAALAGLGVVCRHDDAFPGALLDADDAPRMLYMAGDAQRIQWLGETAVTVVGSRRPTAYGLEVARSLSFELAAARIPVVSGMALGVDSAAHRGALDANGPTVAVLAGGADTPYPRSKRDLYKRISKCGLLISEMPPSFKPHRWCFPARNRIMAGLGAMTVVVEAAERSGTLITAEFARQLGREVGAVPGPVNSSRARGTNALLADGARVVRGGSDVVEELFGPGATTNVGDKEAERRNSGRNTAHEQGRGVERDCTFEQNRILELERDLEPELASLLEQVENHEGSIDDLASNAEEAGRLLAQLGQLESFGLIRLGPDGRYLRTAGSTLASSRP